MFRRNITLGVEHRLRSRNFENGTSEVVVFVLSKVAHEVDVVKVCAWHDIAALGCRSIASCCSCNFCGCHWSSASRNATNSVLATFHAALRVPPGPTFDGMSSTRIGIAEVAAYSLASCKVLSVLTSLATMISVGCSVCCATLCRARSKVCAAL